MNDASILFPWHKELDTLEEERLKDKKYGSTKQGIAPFYSDKYQKKTILMGELLYSSHLYEHIKDILDWKNLVLNGVYGASPIEFNEIKKWIEEKITNPHCPNCKFPFLEYIENPTKIQIKRSQNFFKKRYSLNFRKLLLDICCILLGRVKP